MQLYDITITASQTRQLDAPGNYFYYYAGSAGGADPTITLRGLSSGLRIVLKPGQAFRLPAGSTENSWVMTNYAGAATIIGSVIVGNGEITDNRITGSVEVVDGGKNRTLGKTAFMVGGQKTGVAAQYSFLQLWNPAGTGKNLIVEAMNVGSSSAGSLWIFGETSTRPTLLATPTSKLINSGAASVGQLKSDNSASAPAGPMFSIAVAANATQQIKFNEPIIVPPGTALTTMHTAFGADVLSTFELFEESAT